jgi:AcrR family transcriptional regulator
MAGSYHHGDLRRALLAAALELLEKGGSDALTLRGVAAAVGVSRAAPYRHFRDRRDLVAAVAEESFRRMRLEIGVAVEHGPGGLAALHRGLRAYAEYAEHHPARYRVMFGPELSQRDGLPGLDRAAHDLFEVLREPISRMQRGGIIGPGEPTHLAITAWATIHGLVMLSLDGQTEATGETAEQLVEAAIALLIKGLTARPNPG